MKNKLLILVFTLFSGFHMHAQDDNHYLVTGIVTDSVSSESIPYVTVSISSYEAPMNYIKRVAADVNGKFELKVKNVGNYLVNFESVGMQTLWNQVIIEQGKKKYDLGKVKMSVADELLNELTVLAAKPLVKMEMDKIVYDTQSDPEAKSNTVLDMLRKVPMITVDGEDKIQVKGSSSFKVYMNGKPSNITATNPSQVLKSLPASTIKSIEVITEPGAKYDAEGVGGIINIVTEKALKGYTGSFQAGVESRGTVYGGAYFSTKVGKFGITANANYQYYQEEDREIQTRRNNTNPLPFKYLNQESNMGFNYNYYFVNLEASYEFDSLNLLSLSFGKNGSAQTLNQRGYTEALMEDLDTLFFYSNDSHNKYYWGGIDANLDYQRSFKKPHKLLTVSYRLGMSPMNTENKSVINVLKDDNAMVKSSNRLTSTLGQSDEHTLQVDYVEPFNKKHVVEAGLKYILRLNNSENKYDILENGEYVKDTSYNKSGGDLNHTQHILGVYGSYTFKMDKFSIRAGARYEYTNSLVRYLSDRERNFDAPFSNLIPSVILSFQPNMTSNLQLSYTQRISRPGIDYLNPFVDDTDPSMISRGNPTLKAEVNNTFNLSYGMFSQKLSLNASLYTSFNNNAIEQVTDIKSDGVIEQTYENIGKSSQTGLYAYANWAPIELLRLYANGSVSYLYYKSDSNENDGIRYSIVGGAQVNLPWKLKFNANAGYYSPWVMLEGKGSEFYFVGASLGRSFFNDKLNVNFRINEPFRKKSVYKFSIEKEGLYKMDTRQTAKALSFGVSVSYRFGEMKEQIKKAKRGITNDDVKSSGQGEVSGAGNNIKK